MYIAIRGQALPLLITSIFDKKYCVRYIIAQQTKISEERRIDYASSISTGSGPLYPDPRRKSERKERLT